MLRLVKLELTYSRDLFLGMILGVISITLSQIIMVKILKIHILISPMVLVCFCAIGSISVIRRWANEKRHYLYAMLPLSRRQVGISRLILILSYMTGLLLVFSLYNFLVFRYFPAIPGSMSFNTIFFIISLSLLFIVLYLMLVDLAACLPQTRKILNIHVYKLIEAVKQFYFIFGVIFYIVFILSFMEKYSTAPKNALQNALGEFAQWFTISFSEIVISIISGAVLILLSTFLYENRKSYLE